MSSWLDAGATFSPCGAYRHRLWRVWDERQPALAWVMLNPSTADHRVEDPTIKTCIRLSRSWGYGGLVVGNIFQLRATDPEVMKAHADPIGPEGDEWLLTIASTVAALVCAWGNHGRHLGRAAYVRKLLAGRSLFHVGVNDKGRGEPRHPLYLPNTTQPQVLA